MSDDLRDAAAAWMEDAEAFGIEDLLVDGSAGSADLQIRSDGEAGSGSETGTGTGADLEIRAPGGEPESSPDSLEKIAAEIAACTRCGLARTRNRVVPGQGAVDARIMFVGEAPGADEDAQGLAFVGRAGQLLTRMIAAMGFQRDEVFIANVLKCRPPGNRDPRPDEVACCLPFLKRQIARIRPEVLIALGGHAMKNLLATEASVGRMRGRVHDYDGTPLVVTYHPAYLLRSPEMKRKAWEDLQLALRTVGLEPPPRS